ncbi:hypothetical protein WJX81_004246 [Elliptochloris bilobata]|uniref:Uncharacterized protein n=1 Tax=Elliptochloris bilobata TaxID=381761 RepID=A0AAW1RYS2_9CHLO
MAPWSAEDIPDLTGRVVIVTGANTGLGLETAKALACRGAHTFITSRDTTKGSKAVADIKAKADGAKVEMLQLDLASFESVKAAAAAFLAKNLPLHTLILNAGVFLPPHLKTQQGFELMVGTAYFGHALLVELLLPKTKASAPARIVWMSGALEAQAKLRWDDLGLEQATNSGMAEAAHLNALRIMAAFELNKRLAGSGVDVFAVHPGVSRTEGLTKIDSSKLMAQVLGMVAPLIAQPASRGALSTLYAATAPELTGHGGGYYGPNMLNMGNTVKREPGNKYAKDPANWQRAWDQTLQILRAKGGLAS